MKALVTGGRGFIGSFLVEALLEKGYEVHCLLRKGSLGWLKGLDIRRIDGDITEPEALQSAVRNMDYIFHLAGALKARNLTDFQKINAGGAKNLLEAVGRNNTGVSRFVLVSSLSAAGPSPAGRPVTETDPPHPVSNYGKSKLLAEKIALEYANKFPVTIVRPPAVYGPRERDIFIYFKYAKKGWRPELSGGPRSFSAIYVKDLVQGILLAAEQSNAVGETYFLCNDVSYSWDEVGKAIASVLGVQTKRLPLPLSLAFLSAIGSELFGRLTNRLSVINLDKYRELKMQHWVCDNYKARKELGFKTEFDLEKGLTETAEWYVEHGWL